MQASQIPAKFPEVFGANADPSNIRAVPATTTTPGAWSLDIGLSPLNFLNTAAGGIPPFGQDTNGLFNQIVGWSQWQNAGGAVPYDATFQSDVGGYPAGAVVASGTLSAVRWLSLTDDNVTDPDTGGSGWQAVGGGAASIASASTTDIGAVPQASLTVTANNTINSFGPSMPAGTIKVLTFQSALILTYNATSLILPGQANLATAAGDTAVVQSLGGGNYNVVLYQRASGQPLSQVVQTGLIEKFMGTTAPAGYVEMNGGTIGSASSGSSLRANADTANLFALAWALSATVSPIFTSSGASSTRGANAAADFAANKRITIPDGRGIFDRNWDDGAGIDSGRVLGSTQADAFAAHNHGVTDPGHVHTYSAPQTAHNGPEGANETYYIALATPNTGSATTGITINNTGGTETRPKNIAWLVVVKL